MDQGAAGTVGDEEDVRGRRLRLLRRNGQESGSVNWKGVDDFDKLGTVGTQVCIHVGSSHLELVFLRFPPSAPFTPEATLKKGGGVGGGEGRGQMRDLREGVAEGGEGGGQWREGIVEGGDSGGRG